MRRAALSPYFSMASVRRLQPVIQERIDVLLERLRGFREGGSGSEKNAGEVLMASWAFAALTNGELSAPHSGGDRDLVLTLQCRCRDDLFFR
jgi:hypothetical protein